MKKIRKVVFPVGGLGTRLLPATKAIPKEMLPIWDKPLIQYAVEEAINSGLEQFIFVTSSGKTSIENHFDKNQKLSNIGFKKKQKFLLADLPLDSGQIIYIRQKEPLGLGDAIYCTRHVIGRDPFALILADDFILSKKPCLSQMIDIFKENQTSNIAAVMNVDEKETKKYGILDINHNYNSLNTNLVKAFRLIEKPSPKISPSRCAIVGRYILQPEIFKTLSIKKKDFSGEIQLTGALSSLISTIPFLGLYFKGTRYDCGSKIGMLSASVAMGISHDTLGRFAEKEIKKILDGISKQRKMFREKNL